MVCVLQAVRMDNLRSPRKIGIRADPRIVSSWFIKDFYLACCETEIFVHSQKIRRRCVCVAGGAHTQLCPAQTWEVDTAVTSYDFLEFFRTHWCSVHTIWGYAWCSTYVRWCVSANFASLKVASREKSVGEEARCSDRKICLEKILKRWWERALWVGLESLLIVLWMKFEKQRKNRMNINNALLETSCAILEPYIKAW